RRSPRPLDIERFQSLKQPKKILKSRDPCAASLHIGFSALLWREYPLIDLLQSGADKRFADICGSPSKQPTTDNSLDALHQSWSAIRDLRRMRPRWTAAGGARCGLPPRLNWPSARQ